MGILLIILGIVLNYFGWKLLLTVSDKKANRHFRTWWTKGETEEDSEGLRTVNATLFIMTLICIGMVLLIGGVASYFT